MSVTVYDNGGETFDRYTVFLNDYPGACLAIGGTGNATNGVCMHVEAEDGPHLGEEIDLENMTEPARRAVLAMLREYEAEDIEPPKEG